MYRTEQKHKFRIRGTISSGLKNKIKIVLNLHVSRAFSEETRLKKPQQKTQQQNK